MPHFDLFRELSVIIGATVATGILAVVYAGLEKVFPFLKGGFGRLN